MPTDSDQFCSGTNAKLYVGGPPDGRQGVARAPQARGGERRGRRGTQAAQALPRLLREPQPDLLGLRGGPQVQARADILS